MKQITVRKFLHILSRLATLILGGITIVGAFASYVPPTQSTFLAFLGLFLSALILLNIIFIIYWAIRRRFWVWVPVIAIIANSGFLSSTFQFQLREKTLAPNHQSLTIATYNVHSFGKEADGYSCKEIARYMGEQKVDVICFQEFMANKEFTADSIKKAFSAWKYSVTTPLNLDLLHLAIFSKYPISNSEVTTYSNSNNCSLWCDISINKKKVRIFNNHLQTTNLSQNRQRLQEELKRGNGNIGYLMYDIMRLTKENFIKREQQVETVHKFTLQSPYPVLLCSDLNSIPSSYAYRAMEGNLKDGFKTCGRGYAYTFRYYKHMLRIDYIFHSAELQGIRYFSPDLDLCSDHNPVIMEVGMEL
ncbi:MAG: putative transrane endonuclease/exonuclease/phosphatase family protein [Bacteroidetes bacterium]|nr:putative transrane endonuclease/exonuclease/phosphatase family protein [Bacteroidota bacterium]